MGLWGLQRGEPLTPFQTNFVFGTDRKMLPTHKPFIAITCVYKACTECHSLLAHSSCQRRNLDSIDCAEHVILR